MVLGDTEDREQSMDTTSDCRLSLRQSTQRPLFDCRVQLPQTSSSSFCSMRSVYLTLSTTNVVTVTVLQMTAEPSSEPTNICCMSPVHREKNQRSRKGPLCVILFYGEVGKGSFVMERRLLGS